MAAWTPANLATAPALWFDASDGATITAVSGAVSQWNDKSGNARNATQATAAQKPLNNNATKNSLVVLTFGFSVESKLAHASVLSSAYSAFYVCNPTTVTTNPLQVLHGGDVGGGAIEFAAAANFSPGGMGSFTNANSRIESGAAPTGWQILGFEPTKLYRNGSEVGAYKAGAATVNGSAITTIGSRSDSSSFFFIGDIAEIVVCDATVSANDRQRIEGYLAAKWGMQASLPSNHPFKSVAPDAGVASGSVSATEAADTSVATAVSPIKGTMSATEAADTGTSTAIAPARASVSATEATDSAISTAIAMVKGAVSSTEAADTSTATGISIVRGSVGATEAADTTVASAVSPIHGAVSAIEVADSFTATGQHVSHAVVSAVEAPDTVAAYGANLRLLRLDATEEGYQVTFTGQVRSDALDGGVSRFRRDLLAANPIASVQWVTSQSGFDYLQAFYRLSTDYGAEGFQIRLFVESGALEEYWAKFLPGSFQLSSVSGDAYTATAKLEILSPSVDPEMDAAIVLSYEEYGDDASAIYDLLAQLVNVTMPSAWA